jgi:outer membrane protein assembly factor BamE (lipoprotein component of BamABCDE complex)
LLSNASQEQVLINTGGGWKSVTNWRKLTTDMSYDEVRKILGEPHRIDGGSVAFWHYQNGGNATFVSDRLQSWQEPRQ